MKTLREYILESVQSDYITLDDNTKLKFYEVSDYSELKKIIKESAPDKAINKGFRVFSEALKRGRKA